MAEIQTLQLDLLPAYIPFLVQCQASSGAATNPSVDSLIIYEEGGADATFDATTITGSPFDPAQYNSETGLWGVLVPKSALTAGKCYIAYWEMSVDGTAAAKVELYFACNASDFKATGFSTHDAAAVVSAMQAVAGDFKATGFSTFDPATDQVIVGTNNDKTGYSLSTAPATPTDITNLQSHGDTTWATATGFSTHSASDVWSAGTRTLTGYGTLVSDIATAVWTATTRTLSEFGFTVTTDAASRNASKADVSGLALSSEITALQSHGDTTWATATGFAAPGDAMTLTAGERSSLAAAIEAAIIDELDGTAVMQAIADLIADDMTTGDLSVQAIAAACRDAILDRVLSGNHDAAGTPGKLLQDGATSAAVAVVDGIVDAIKLKTDNLPADPAGASDLSGLSTFDPASDTVVTDSASREASKADVSGLATSVELTALQGHGDAEWATATGFSTHAASDVVVAMQAAADDFKADVSAISDVTVKIDTALELDGAVYRLTANALEQAPAGGGSTNVNVVSVNDVAVAGPDDFKADTSGLATGAEITALQGHGDAAWITATGFSTHSASDVVVALQAVADDFKADVSNLDATVSSRLAASSYVPVDVSGIESVTDKIDTAIEADGAVFRFTANALEQAPAGGGGTDVNVISVGGTSVAGPSDLQADLSGVAQESTLDLVKVQTDRFGGMIELDGATYRFTQNALEQAPVSSDTSGLYGVTLQVYETGTTTSIGEVDFAIRQGGVLVTWGRTALDGSAAITLDPGEYDLYMRKTPVSFVQEAFTVASDGETFTFYGTTPATDDPLPSDICEIYEVLRVENPDTIPTTVSAYAKIINLPHESGGQFFAGDKISPDLDTVTGEITWRIVSGATVYFEVDTGRYRIKGTALIPGQDRAKLQDLLGL